MADLLQILNGTGARPRVTFYSGGVATDLDSSAVPTVTITKPDGSTIASGTVTRVSVGTYEFALAPQAECTLLTVTWTGPIGGITETLATYVEVVGAHLFGLAEAKSFDGGAIVATSNSPAVTDQQILDARTRLTNEFEQILGFAPVPRYGRAVEDGDGSGTVALRTEVTRDGTALKALRLLSVTVGGTAQPVGNYALRPSGVLEATAGFVASGVFTAGRRNVVVEYVSGDRRVDPATSRAALIVARAQLVRSDVTDRATSISSDLGVVAMATAGRATLGGDMQWYGLPLVDSVLNRRLREGLAPA